MVIVAVRGMLVLAAAATKVLQPTNTITGTIFFSTPISIQISV
jgi:hypothetical protein